MAPSLHEQHNLVAPLKRLRLRIESIRRWILMLITVAYDVRAEEKCAPLPGFGVSCLQHPTHIPCSSVETTCATGKDQEGHFAPTE
jgi:hypothetical protein